MPSSEGISSQDFTDLKLAIDESAIVAITDKHGIITYVNDKFCAISKYSRAELLGQNHRLIKSGHHPQEFFIEMWKKISAGHTWEGEIRNRAKNGSYYWVNTTIVPFKDQTGRPIKYVAVRYEITQRKVAEEQLKIYTKKLEVSNQELQEFASVAAHDLQEPLRKIQSFSDRLRTKTKGILEGDLLDYFERIQNSAKRMQILINDLLSYARVTTKAQPFSFISLGDVLTHVISDLGVRIEQTKGKVSLGNLPSIEADRTQMHQLFQNLIGNALKFSKAGTSPIVKIEAEVVGQPMLGSAGQVCQITVQDNGIGFDEKYLDRIFIIFQRLHGRHEFEGTGIGLAICRKIVDRHGGQITAKSKVGHGATFIVSLPMIQMLQLKPQENRESQ